MTTVFAGLDIGTTWIKAARVGGDGIERVIERVPTPWREVPTGAEADPDDVFDACVEVLGRVLSDPGESSVGAIGITGMAETGVLLSRDGTPAAPCIAWFDRRGEESAMRIADEIGETFTLRTGLPASRLCSLAKLLWLSERSGGLPAPRWLDLPEYVAFRLTGRQAAEASLVCRTGLFDVRTAAPFAAAHDMVGAGPDFLAELLRSGDVWGHVVSGPGHGSAVTVAGHDDPVAALGAGAIDAGDVFDSCGTAEGYLRAMPDPLSDDQVLGLSAGGCTVGTLPGGGLRALGGFEAGGIVARWRRRLHLTDDAIASVDAAAAALDPGAGGVSIDDLWGDPVVHGPDPSPEQLWRAVFEALAARGEIVLDAMQEVVGPPSRLVVSGGGAQGATVRAVKGERFTDLVRPDVREAAARGAALAAGVALGAFADLGEVPRPSMRPYV